MYYQNNEPIIGKTLLKVAFGQVCDLVNPKMGLACHVTTIVTSKNEMDLALSFGGALGSMSKICCNNNNRYYAYY